MRRALRYLLSALVFLGGCGLLYLSNTGLLSIGDPYVRQASLGLPERGGPVAFVGVNVVPMDHERVLENRTVLVRDGRVEEIGKSRRIIVPKNYRVVRGGGRYLMPGLVDVHVHVEEEDDLLLYAANGVTTVRNMWGNTGFKRAVGYPDQLELRGEVERGEILGPRIFTTGPVMEGEPPSTPIMPVVRTPQEARASVAWQAGKGYDFVKVYDNLSPEVYRAVLDEARKQGMPVVGHVPGKVGLDAALAGGQLTVEHLIGYLDPDAARLAVPGEDLESYALRTREAGVYNCPTIGLYQKLVPEGEVDNLERGTDGLRYVSPRTRATWRLFLPQMREDVTYPGNDYPDRIEELYKSTTRVLHEHGAIIVAGTDASNPYLVPGFSLHDELENLTEAGLSPYEALQAATTNTAEALGEPRGAGTVAEGMRADLILTQDNPLRDVAKVERPAGVMLGKHWLPEDDLERLLDGLAASHRPTVFERLWPLVFFLCAVLLLPGAVPTIKATLPAGLRSVTPSLRARIPRRASRAGRCGRGAGC